MPNADPAPAGESAAARFCRQQCLALQDDPAITGKRMFVVKFPAPQIDHLIASGDAVLFDPGHGRTSKTWAAVSAQASGRWEGLARNARAFVAG
jgi:hypothetical protein